MSQRLFKIDVLIVGAGPVGLTAAIELARYGVPIRIIDSAKERSKFSKACVIWPRTLEQLQRHLIINKELHPSKENLVDASRSNNESPMKRWMTSDLAKKFILCGHTGTTSHIYEDHRLLITLDHSKIDSPFPFYLVIGQCVTERLLEERLIELGGIVERCTELVKVYQDSDGVSASVSVDGYEQIIHCRWLIAADGSHSTVRKLCNLKFQGVTLPVEWVTIDCTVTAPDPSQLPEGREVHSTPTGACGFILLEPPNNYRVACPIGPAPTDRKHRDRPAPTLEEVQKLLDKYDNRNLVLSNPKWIARFMINERLVENYRHGRIFLAGDAAHVHSPAGGQGMNLGMHDAVNLAWKLAMIVNGQICDAAAEVLLTSYGAERRPIAEATIKASGTLTRILAVDNRVYKWLISRALSIGSTLFNLEGALVNNLTFATWNYYQSPLNKESSYISLYSLTAKTRLRVGERYPLPVDEAPLSAGDSPHFTLATVSENHSRARNVCKSFAHILSGTVILNRNLNSGSIILIRPDGFIAFVSNSADWAGVCKYLSKLTRTRG